MIYPSGVLWVVALNSLELGFQVASTALHSLQTTFRSSRFPFIHVYVELLVVTGRERGREGEREIPWREGDSLAWRFDAMEAACCSPFKLQGFAGFCRCCIG